MPSRDIGVGGVFTDLAVLGIATAISYLDGRPNDRPIPQASSSGQRSELEAHAEALHALDHAKAIIADRCVRLLALPTGGLLDVANACSTHTQDGGELAAIRNALEALVGRADSAVVLSNELISSTKLGTQGSRAIEQFGADLATLGLLLRNLLASAKHILSQIQLSTEPLHADLVGSIRSALQDFLAVNRPGIEDAVTIWAARELEHNGDSDQPSYPSISAQGLAIIFSTFNKALALSGLKTEGAEMQFGLGNDAYFRYGTSHSIEDIDRAIDHYKMAFDLTFPGNSYRSVSLNNLGLALSSRFDQLGRIADLEQAIIYYHGALELTPGGHPNRSMSLNNLGLALSTRFDHLRQIADLEQAIIYYHGALELHPVSHPDRSMSFNNLANVLSTRFEQLGQIADLHQAIIYYHGALELRPAGHPNRSNSLNNLATELSTRFDQLGQIADLEQAIIYYRSALELHPASHPDRSTSLTNLGLALSTRYDRLGKIADSEQAIIYHREALELRPASHPDRSNSFNNLGLAFRTRFGQLGQIMDLEQAIICHREALELRPAGHPDRSMSFNNLANALRARYDQLGQIADLEQAIIYLRDALELHPAGHPNRSTSLTNLGLALSTRFDQLGQIADSEQAIIYLRDAIELVPPGHPNRSNTINNLANALRARFGQLGQIADLKQAIIYYRGALELCPPGHPDRSSSLNNLGAALSTCFSQLGQIADSEQAIIYYHEALELRLVGHPDRSSSLNNLGAALSTRFSQLGQIADLEQAIIYYHEALELRPVGHPDRSSSLNNLATMLRTRFDQLGQIADLEQAIIYLRDALELLPAGHPDRFGSLDNLATALRIRFERSKITQYLREAVNLLQSGSQDATDTPKHRYTCALRLITLLEKHNQSLLLNAYDMALGLLQLLLAVYPDVELRRQALGADILSPSLAMSAAAHAIQQNQPEKAIEMLEQGRGMLYSNIRGYREPVDAVRRVNAALANRFKATSEQLEALAISSQLGSNRLSSEKANESAAVSDARWARQRQLSSERDKIIEEIRCLFGFEHFLKAVPFNELRSAAAEGPIIIVNVAQQRSDAIILHKDHPPAVISVPADPENNQSAYLTFQDLSKQLFGGRGRDGFSLLLEVILKKLEELLVAPVLEKLQSLGLPDKSRIWWCPTSTLCALPIHAAGELPVKYIISYTPTLSALISARKVDDQQPPATLNSSENKLSLLAIVYPGHPPRSGNEPDRRLKTVFDELRVIEKAAGKTLSCAVVRAPATREGSLEQLLHHRWMHFACHGHLNISQPFQSAFELEDDPLSLSDLVHAHLPRADFAFLAACDSATSGGTTDTPDEALHFAAAVQFCGVRSVVGTLWPMADEDGPRVAQVFYRHMFQENDPRRSAEALHKVVSLIKKNAGPWKNARDEGELLQRWANYVHIGA
ncbi:hypothetical protein HWV62_36747 [Athelia sp. TMB]|nr:hypothetical protein HWV62_36747 [Athelia sp. TMB]